MILEAEDHTTYKMRNKEGLWDGRPFEIAGAERCTAQKIRNALKHCAKNPNVEVAIILLPEVCDPRNTKRH